ncbi:MAG TPA: hypothetical protein PLY77_08310, partial [Plasticicumulans sp.]|nr:hypothetical protein [Plasticicumulans sp.]
MLRFEGFAASRAAGGPQRLPALLLLGLLALARPLAAAELEVGGPAGSRRLDSAVLLATRTQTFGGASSVQTTLSIRNPAGEVLRSAVEASELPNAGDLGTVRALVSDGDGGAVIAGDGASGTLEPWFLRRVRPATVVSSTTTNRTFTNLWSSRTAGPFTNGLQNLSVPHGADVVT